MSGRRILVTGCSGYLGRAIVCALLEHGDVDVLVGADIRRSPALAGLNDSRLRLIAADVAEPLDDVLREHRIDTVLHTAFVLRPSHDRKRTVRTNIEGARQVLRACAACGVEHLLHVSSASVYGFTAKQISLFEETAPLNPYPGFTYAEDKARSDELVHEARRNGTVPAITVLRPSFIIGADSDNPLYEHLTRKLVVLPKPMSSLQLAHIDDLCAAVLLLLARRPNETYNLAGRGALTPLEMVQRLHGTVVLLPKPLLHGLNQIAWALHAKWLTNAPSIAVRSLEGFWHVSSQKLEEEMGFRFQHTTETAFDSFVQTRAGRRYEKRFG